MRIMKKNWKLILVAVLVIVAVLGMFLYLLLAKPGNVLMSIIYGCGGIVIGWVAHVLYARYVKRQ